MAELPNSISQFDLNKLKLSDLDTLIIDLESVINPKSWTKEAITKVKTTFSKIE